MRTDHRNENSVILFLFLDAAGKGIPFANEKRPHNLCGRLRKRVSEITGYWPVPPPCGWPQRRPRAGH